MAAKKILQKSTFSAKTLKFKGVIRLTKKFNYKSVLAKALEDKYELKRAHD
jgi:hypothetical protein